MTPKMEAALQAALDADEKGGLCWTVAGWIDPSHCWTYHNQVSVSRLIWPHGYLVESGKRSGKNARRVITQKGRDYLSNKALKGAA